MKGKLNQILSERLKLNTYVIIRGKDLPGFTEPPVFFKDPEKDQPTTKLHKRADVYSKQKPTIQKAIPQIEKLNCFPS